MSQVELSVPSISCGHCERTIVGALQPVPGVQEVSVDIASRKVRLEFDAEQVSLDQIEAILAEQDYPVAPEDAPQDAPVGVALPMVVGDAESPSCACCAI